MKFGLRYLASVAFAALLGAGAISGASANSLPSAAGANSAVNADVTIYGNRYAQVQETRTVSLKQGANLIQLPGISSAYLQNSLRVLGAKGPGNFTYRSATFQAANLNTESVLAQYVGKEVEIYRQNAGDWLKGKLEAVSGDRYILLTDNGGTAIVTAGSEIRLSGSPKGLSSTSSLTIEAEVGQAGDYQITFMYETGGLAWSAKHDAVLDETKNQLTSWQTVVSIVNNTGISVRNATVRLVSGAVTDPGMEESRMYAKRAAAPASFDTASEAGTETVGDQKTYIVPTKLDLGSGQTRQVLLLEGKSVPVTKQYIVPSAQYEQSTQAQLPVSVRLTIDNSNANNMGKAIPSGPVKIYQLNAEGIQLQTGAARITSDKAPDEIFDLPIGTASDVKYTRVLSDRKADNTQPKADNTAFEKQTWDVQVFNYKKDKDLSVKIEVYVPNAQDDTKPLTRKSANSAETTVVVPKGGKQTLQYNLRVQTR